MQRWVAIYQMPLRGIGQVMFQGNALTGMIFVMGIALQSWQLALAAYLGSCIGTLWAMLCRYPIADIRQGLYGFNACLVAIAAVYFYGISEQSLLLLVLGSVVATVLMRWLQIRQLPAYTFPFVLTTWIFFYLCSQQNVLPLEQTTWGNDVGLDGVLQGFGQVMFQANSWTGLCFLVGIAISSFRHAWWAVVAAGAGLWLARLLGIADTVLSDGIYSYNAVLVAIAMALLRQHIGVMLLVVALSVLILFLMQMWQMPALTFPFILAVWLFSIVLHWQKITQKSNEMV